MNKRLEMHQYILTVLGFDSFMEERVWDAEEARQHREAKEVMICS